MPRIYSGLGIIPFFLFGASVSISTALTQLSFLVCAMLLCSSFLVNTAPLALLKSSSFRPALFLCISLLFIYAFIAVRYFPGLIVFDERAVEVVSKYKKLLFFAFLLVAGFLGSFALDYKKSLYFGLSVAFYVISAYVIATFVGLTELVLGSPAEKDGIFFWYLGDSASSHWLALMESPGISFGRNYISQAFFVGLIVAYEFSGVGEKIGKEKTVAWIKISLGLLVLLLMGGKTGVVFIILFMAILSLNLRGSKYRSLMVACIFAVATVLGIFYFLGEEPLALARFENWIVNTMRVLGGETDVVEKSRLWFHYVVLTKWLSGDYYTFLWGEGLQSFIFRTGSDNPHSEFLHGIIHGGIVLVIMWAFVLRHLAKTFRLFYPVILVVSVAFFMNGIVWDFGEGYILAAFILLMAMDSGEGYREA